MLGPDIELNISIPDQTLTNLSFSETTPAAITAWVKNLPMANVGETARQLYQSIMEMNQLAIAPAVRSQMLETVRPAIRYVSQELSKHFLNQSVTLPLKQLKIANLANALEMHLATGYKAVMVDSLSNMGQEKVRKNFACAAHRMMSEYGQVLLRTHQLYSSPPKDIWKEMHSVYQFCEALDLFKYMINDEHNKHEKDTRIDQAYKRNLLLSCCRPNQLRQTDVEKAYEVFEVWSDYVEVGAEYSSSAVFVANMSQDMPPRYRSLLHDTLSDHYYGFDTAELVSRLTNHISALTRKQDDGVVHLSLPISLPDNLFQHLNHAFGILTKRTFKRIANSGHITLCVGLSASHYYSSGEVTFHTQMLNKAQDLSEGDNIFMSRARKQNDAWSGAHDAGVDASNATPAGMAISFNRAVTKSGEPEYPKHKVPLVNTSPGGYCLQWNDDIPSNVQAGELISVKENDQSKWSIAVIRWIRHSKQKGTQIGVELLAPAADPCGVQLLQKTGAPSEFLRGLLLPEISSIGQATTLITPRLPFQSGQKVALRVNGHDSRCQLDKRVSATGSFSQFELDGFKRAEEEETDKTKGDHHESDSEDDFDSLWPSL